MGGQLVPQGGNVCQGFGLNDILQILEISRGIGGLALFRAGRRFADLCGYTNRFGFFRVALVPFADDCRRNSPVVCGPGIAGTSPVVLQRVNVFQGRCLFLRAFNGKSRGLGGFALSFAGGLFAHKALRVYRLCILIVRIPLADNSRGALAAVTFPAVIRMPVIPQGRDIIDSLCLNREGCILKLARWYILLFPYSAEINRFS